MECEFPVIDFSRCGLLVENDNDLDGSHVERTGQQLYEAFSKYGFAYISNVGLSSEQIDELNEVTGAFFSLPLEDKIKFRQNEAMLGGYDPMGMLMLNPKRGPDFQEAFRVDGAYARDDKSLWPDVKQFKDKYIKMMETLRRLLLRVLKALGNAMKLKDPDLFCKAHTKVNEPGNFSTLKTAYYFPIGEDNRFNGKQIRTGEHSDGGTITLLIQDDNGGLQAQNIDGHYVDVPPIPGTLVLNIGDIMQYWSGGRLRSTMHRVVAPRDPEKRKRTRRSVVYFGLPDNDAMLSSLEFEDGLLNEDGSTEIDKMTVLDLVKKNAKRYWPDGDTLASNNI